jgi:hypothetical protein
MFGYMYVAWHGVEPVPVVKSDLILRLANFLFLFAILFLFGDVRVGCSLVLVCLFWWPSFMLRLFYPFTSCSRETQLICTCVCA